MHQPFEGSERIHGFCVFGLVRVYALRIWDFNYGLGFGVCLCTVYRAKGIFGSRHCRQTRHMTSSVPRL